MGFHPRTPQAWTTAILLLALSLGFVGIIGAQQSNSQSPKCEETDHVRLSTPVVRAWRQIPAGSPVYALDDAVEAKDWVRRSRIQRIDVQTGIWPIWIERGYSVFRIYPYLSKGSPQPSVYQGIVLKVNGALSVGDMVTAIRKRDSRIRIDSYAVFGGDGVSVQRYSRSPQRGAP